MQAIVPSPERVAQRVAIVLRAQRRVHLHVRVERANGLVGEHEVVRRHLAGRLDAVAERGVERRDGLARRQVHQVDRPLLERGEREVALDHHALGRRRIRAEAELGGDRALVHMAAARQRRLLAVERERRLGDARCTAARGACRPADTTGRPSSVKAAAPAAASSAISRQLLAELALADRGHEPGRHDRLLARTLDERAEHRRRVDDGLGVRHREDRAVAAARGRLRPACAIVSSSSRPGVRRWTCGSTNAGATTSAAAAPGLDSRDHAVLRR